MATAKSIQDIIEWTEQLSSPDGRIFRGQTDKWPLKPKILRDSTRKEGLGFDEGDYLKTIEAFKRKASKYLDVIPSSEIEWWAIAQHHGLPTLLLDWTYSVLIAAYFACKDMGAGSTNRQAMIYSLANVSESIVEDRALSLYNPNHSHVRISSQQSCFTLAKMNHLYEDADKLLIDKNSEGKIKIQLSKIGIDAHSIFPDLEGLANSIAWNYKWGFPTH